MSRWVIVCHFIGLSYIYRHAMLVQLSTARNKSIALSIYLSVYRNKSIALSIYLSVYRNAMLMFPHAPIPHPYISLYPRLKRAINESVDITRVEGVDIKRVDTQRKTVKILSRTKFSHERNSLTKLVPWDPSESHLRPYRIAPTSRLPVSWDCFAKETYKNRALSQKSPSNEESLLVVASP